MPIPKTLLYLASGYYMPIYETLPFDRVILVDHNYFDNDILPFGSKVRLMKMDALEAIKILRKEGVVIHAFVSMNEGLFDGYGEYPIFCDAVLGYVSPILSDEVLVIYDQNNHAHGQRGNRAGNFGFKVKKIPQEHPLYIEPTYFSCVFDSTVRGAVFSMKRTLKITPLPNQWSVKINLVHGSIWQDKDELDRIGLNLRPRNFRNQPKLVNDFFLSHDRVVNIHGKTFVEIITEAEADGIGRLGLTPWKNGDYEEVFDYLRSHRLKIVRSITFYHLNKRDFKGLYQRTLR